MSPDDPGPQDSPARSTTSGWLSHPSWTGIGSIAAVGSLIVAVFFGVAQCRPATTVVAPTTSPAPVHEGLASTTSTRAEPDPAPSTGPTCVSSNDAVTPCSARGASLVVDVAPCSVDTVQAALGIDPAGRQLDLETRSLSGGRCAARPGELAAAGGAATQSLAALSPTSTSALTLCRVVQSGPDISCSRPHHLEYVGPWKELRVDRDAGQDCDVPVREYVGADVERPDSQLRAVRLNRATDPVTYRCAVAASVPLKASVWGLGGGPLTTAE